MVLNKHSKANHHPPNNQMSRTRSKAKPVTRLYGLYSKDLGTTGAMKRIGISTWGSQRASSAGTIKGYGSGAVWLPSLGALFRKHGYIGVSEGFLKGQF